MSVKLLLAGRYGGRGDEAPDGAMAWLKRAHRFFAEEAGEHLDGASFGHHGAGHPTLSLRLHPAAEPLSIVAADGARVVVGAATASVGPGYHRFVCGLLHRLGRSLAIEWSERDPLRGIGDPTGFFETSEGGALERQMLAHLSTLAERALALRRQGHGNLSLPLREGWTFDHEGALLTALGPRDQGWLEEVARDPTRGTDVFPWWAPGWTPRARLNRALVRLWTEMVWRPPLLQDERRMFEQVAGLLAQARREDPSLPFPWREWRELLAYLGRGGTLAEEVARRALEQQEQPLIGYRRGPVQIALRSGWSVRVPGSLAEELLPDGSWVARDHRRSVRLVELGASAFSLPEGERLTHRSPRMESEASTSFDGEGATLTAVCRATAGPQALCLVSTRDPDDVEWALSTWRSIDCVARA